jgi:hypothetical protein
MADLKISALPASTTPLAGTEVLPIVQSGVTRQVSVANLTVGRAISATQLTLTTGNLIVASGQGVDFSATSGTGTSELLADYEEGTFTPTLVYSGTNTPTYNTQLGRYTKIGRMVQAQIYVNWNENGSTGNVTIGALPFTSVTSLARPVPSIMSFGLLAATVSITGFVNSNATTIYLALNDNAATALSATNTDNDQDIYLTVTYEAA